MKTILWNKATHNRITVIPSRCQIIISAEQNKFILLEQRIGFHMQHYIGGMLLNATFLWTRKIDRSFMRDKIGFFESKPRYPRLNELIVLKCEIQDKEDDEVKVPNSVLFTTDVYEKNEIEITEIIEPIKNLPVFYWKVGDSNYLSLPDECTVYLPKNYNFVHGCFDYFLCISDNDNPNNELEALKLIWTVPIKRIPVKINSKNPNFKITERFLAKEPLWTLGLKKQPYKITDPTIIGIQLTITLHLDDKLKVVRLLEFAPVYEKTNE